MISEAKNLLWGKPPKVAKVKHDEIKSISTTNRYEILSCDEIDDEKSISNDFKGITEVHQMPPPKSFKQSVESWRENTTSNDYYVAAKRMACVHRLLQVQGEITKALEVHQDYKPLKSLRKTVKTLQRSVVETCNSKEIENGLVEAEKANV